MEGRKKGESKPIIDMPGGGGKLGEVRPGMAGIIKPGMLMAVVGAVEVALTVLTVLAVLAVEVD